MWLRRSGLIVAIALLAGVTLLAQTNETILTIAVQEWQQDLFDRELLAEFEAQHPGTKVVTVTLGSDDVYWGINVEDIGETLDRAATYAAQADVLPLGTYQLAPEITRAGIFLDLTPLLTSDATGDVEDFYPAALQSYQWDGGTWGLPITATVQLVVYDRTAFDAAGLAYPDETWTLADFITAGEALTVRDAAGVVTLPGLYGFDERPFMRALLARGLYDTFALPEAPLLDQPELVDLITTWDAYQDALVTEDTDPSGFDYDAIPLMVTGTWRLDNNFRPDAAQREFGASLLPGGTTVIQVEGFGVSAGTQNPELAYALVQFLTRSPEVINRFFGDAPARRSLVGVEAEETFFFRPEREPEVQALIDTALENALPASEMRYFDYLWLARSGEQDDVRAGLQAAQEKALDNLRLAEERRGTTVLAIPTPVPTPVLAASEIALNFYLSGFTSPIPNRDQWDALVAEFVAADPEIGYINLQTGFMDQRKLLEEFDCMIVPYNMVQDADLNQLLPLDPLFASDPTFDAADFLPGVLTSVQRENQTWGLPLTVMPSIINYHSEKFADAGIFAPDYQWTIGDFEMALRQLQDAYPDEKPFTLFSFGNRYLQMLIAAYGGLVVDYSARPNQFDLTSSANVEAIRQALQLARDGLIDYKALDTNMFGGGGGGMPDYAMYDGFLSIDNLFGPFFSVDSDSSEAAANPYRLVLYPRGTTYTPISYSVTSAYISANTQYPNACYRWLSALSARPELHTMMPARRSQIASPELEAAHGAEYVGLYTTLAEYLADPSIVVMPGISGGASFESFISETWMNRAFDRIVLEDGDLETELQEAQRMIDEYLTCVGALPAVGSWMTLTNEEAQEQFKQYVECAVGVDPTLEGRWPTE